MGLYNYNKRENMHRQEGIELGFPVVNKPKIRISKAKKETLTPPGAQSMD